MSDSTFFVSNSLTGRLTESSLSSQSEEYSDFEYEDGEVDLLESVILFKDIQLVMPTRSLLFGSNLEEIVLEADSQLGTLVDILSNQNPILGVNLLDDNGFETAKFDFGEVGVNKYKINLIKPNDSENYQVKIIFN